VILVLALVVNAYRNRGLTVFSEIYRDIFCFRGETKVLTIGGSVNSDQVPLVLLEDGLGCIDYCLWYDFPVVGRAL